MTNRIQDLFSERGIKVAPFARENDITPSTLYAIISGKTAFENIGISIFIKIAEGLGMTAEELYYGTPPTAPEYSDVRQTALNGYFESMNEGGKDTLVASARLMAGSPDVRVEKNSGEDIPLQTAMGA
ncbi:helix-turn-helix domain-containing protein [Adlercreutzia caecimuris]|jgi:transcriptional regulator with XRE-family HTH domain|uniref:HTH cro/C1-type domain-containing protein n=1 Tax=Adlercreutzia caecimuris B7 TaxID=1235794 RepID=R9KX68_9ACTN|nr:helix-turn-helix transcriptional regulator [Adlercreutzia caecimuris]EOS51149.1 hypothetical protein C811_01567 [Adlercreutzia caecimuris B7]